MFEGKGGTAVSSTKTEGSKGVHREAKFPYQLFGRVARMIWPNKTAFALAAIGGTSDRAAKDWLSGKVAAPAMVAAVVFTEIVKPR